MRSSCLEDWRIGGKIVRGDRVKKLTRVLMVLGNEDFANFLPIKARLVWSLREFLCTSTIQGDRFDVLRKVSIRGNFLMLGRCIFESIIYIPNSFIDSFHCHGEVGCVGSLFFLNLASRFEKTHRISRFGNAQTSRQSGFLRAPHPSH